MNRIPKNSIFSVIYHCQIIWECMYCLRLQLSLQDFSPRSQRNSSCQHCFQIVLHFSQNPNTSLSWLQNHASSVVFLLQSSELQHSVFEDTGSQLGLTSCGIPNSSNVNLSPRLTPSGIPTVWYPTDV